MDYRVLQDIDTVCELLNISKILPYHSLAPAQVLERI